ncbi:MAG: Eco29kI family restriction endonuclease [Acidimicrobiales bacterium]
MTSPFNPLDMDNIAESIVNHLLGSPALPLKDVAAHPFDGAGIYAIYYTGPFPAYAKMANANNPDLKFPIYIGKASSRSTQTGTRAIGGRALWLRLRDHHSSITAAQNLRIDDFMYRFSVLEPIWVPLGESLLITRFMPVWNSLIRGFGNHDPGGGRRAGINSDWDVLHAGRAWSLLSAQNVASPGKLQTDVIAYLLQRIP